MLMCDICVNNVLSNVEVSPEANDDIAADIVDLTDLWGDEASPELLFRCESICG
jgi:hypothetical protein